MRSKLSLLVLLLITPANKGDIKSRYLGEIFEDIHCNPVPVLWYIIFFRVPLYVDFDLLNKLFPPFFKIQIEICGLKYKELMKGTFRIDSELIQFSSR